MTARRNGARKLKNLSKSERHVPRRSGLRKNAGMLKLARGYSALQPYQKTHGAPPRTNQQEAREEVEADAIANRDRAMSSPPPARPHQDGSYTIHRTRRSRTPFIFTKKSLVPVDQELLMTRRGPFGSPADPSHPVVVDEALRRGAIMLDLLSDILSMSTPCIGFARPSGPYCQVYCCFLVRIPRTRIL